MRIIVPAASEQTSNKQNKDVSNTDEFDVEKMSPMGHLAYRSSRGQLQRAIAKARARRAGGNSLLADSPNVKAVSSNGDSEEDIEEDLPAGGQAETSIAVDSTGQHVVVGYNDTRGFALNPASISGFMYSDNGGATFSDGVQLPVTTGTSTIGTTILPQVFGDPDIKYVGGCTTCFITTRILGQAVI